MKALKIVLKIVSVILMIWAVLNFITGALNILSYFGLSNFARGATSETILSGVFLLCTGLAYFMIAVLGLKDVSDPRKGRLFIIWSVIGVVLSVIAAAGIVTWTLNTTWPLTSLVLIAICLVPGLIIQRLHRKQQKRDSLPEE